MGFILGTLRTLIGKEDAQPQPIKGTDYREVLKQTKPPVIEIEFSFHDLDDYDIRPKLFEAWIKEQGLQEYVVTEEAPPHKSRVWKRLQFTLDGHLVQSKQLFPNPNYNKAAAIQWQSKLEEEERQEIAKPYDPEMEFITIWTPKILSALSSNPEKYENIPIIEHGIKLGYINSHKVMKLSVGDIYFTTRWPITGKYIDLCLQVSPNIGLSVENIQMPLHKAEKLHKNLGLMIRRCKKALKTSSSNS